MIKFLKFLSDFHLAVSLTDLRGNKATTPYKKFAKEVNNAKNRTDIHTAIKNLKQSLGLEIFKKKEDFIKSFSKLTFSKKEDNLRINFPTQYALKQISNFLEDNFSNESDYTIEHILDEENIEKNKNIGNLIVLENKYNQELNKIKQENFNINYEKKLEIYKKSRYKLVNRFVQEYSKFSEEDIDLRANKLAKFFWDSFFNID